MNLPHSTPSTPWKSPPLLMVGHGTRSAEGAREFEALVERTRKRVADGAGAGTDGTETAGAGAGGAEGPGASADLAGVAGAGIDVAGGFIELASPPVSDAVAQLARRGHRDLVAVPLVLVSAGHGKGDVPAAMARERERHPGLRYRYGRPLGPHPALLSLLEARIDEVLDPVLRAEAAVIVVGRGSSDPDANAEVAKVTRLLWEGRGYAFTEPAFVSLARPGVPAALERARLLGAGRVVVAPYFLFTGVLPQRVRIQAREYATAHPDLDVRVASVLGDCDDLAELVAQRYHEALAGDIRMNCDTCVYRVPMPGFEHRVGAPQAPHHHPEDPALPRPEQPGKASESGKASEESSHIWRDPSDTLPGAFQVSEGSSYRWRDPSDTWSEGYDLRHHGDAEVGEGLVDLAVNVWRPAAPGWLRERLDRSLDDLAAYPRPDQARESVASRHGRDPDGVMLTAGAAEAFTLLARALRPCRAVIVHPQFTEPEAALRAAGHSIEHTVLAAERDFPLDPARVPGDADLVVIGNPTNPTSMLHPAEAVAALARPGRVLVVDEAFMDAVPGEPETLAHRGDLSGLVVVRSLTKTWALAGLRIGYLLAEPEIVDRLAEAQPLWSVSTPALVAAEACSSPAARMEAETMARQMVADRTYLLERLHELPAVEVAGEPRGPFVLMRAPDGLAVREALRRRGFAVRRADTFPGLGPEWLRVAVRDPATTGAFVTALHAVASSP